MYHIQPPVQWVFQGGLSSGIKRQECEMTTKSHRVPKKRMHGVMLQLSFKLHGAVKDEEKEEHHSNFHHGMK
jgi:hypothetical protein